MTVKHKLLLASLAAMPVFGLAVVKAEQAPVTPSHGSTFSSRLAQRKAERQIKLTINQRQRLVSQCQAAQTKLRVVQTDASPIIENRLAVYKRIDAKLWVIIGRIKLANQDTFKLETNKSRLDKKLDIFQSTTDNYEQSLGDTILINCKKDPEGFLALLKTTRIYYSYIQDQISDIGKFVANGIKTSLNSYSDALQPSNNGGDQSGGNQ